MGKRESSTLDRDPEGKKVESAPDVPEPAADGRIRNAYRPGDPCGIEKSGRVCKGLLGVTATFVHKDGSRIRYLQCGTCHQPVPQHKQVIPSRFAGRGGRKARAS